MRRSETGNDAEEPTERLDLWEWTLRHRAFLSAGKRIDFSGHKYLEALYQETGQRVVVQKAAQLGISEWSVSYALHACDQRKANVLYLFPTDRTISDFSAARISPAIEASEHLTAIVGGGVNQTQLKRIRDRYLYLRGAQVKPDGNAAQLKSIDADCVILDEFDEMDPRVFSIAEKRLGHSRIAEQRVISTPSFPGAGVNELFQNSDQRSWFVPCPACGHRQALTVDRLVIEWDKMERPVAWHERDGVPFLACGRCGGKLNRSAAGEWVAAYPGREWVGYHMSKFVGQHINLTDILRNLGKSDETARKEAFNQDLGLPYKPRGGGLTEEQLDDLIRGYALRQKPERRCVMGIDVGTVLHVIIREIPERDSNNALLHVEERIPERRLVFAGEVLDFEEAGRLYKRFNCRACVVDGGPERREAVRFQQSLKGMGSRSPVWLAFYTLNHDGLKQEDPLRWNEEEGIVDVDRTRLLDETLSRFFVGANTLPADIRNVRDYYAHLQAIVRVQEKRSNGRTVSVYVSAGADHLIHAENYCTIASMAPLLPTLPSFVPQASTKGWMAKPR